MTRILPTRASDIVMLYKMAAVIFTPRVYPGMSVALTLAAVGGTTEPEREQIALGSLCRSGSTMNFVNKQT